MEKQTMGSFIAALRRASGMTQRELAERLNVSDKAVSRWERDESAPDLTLIPVIADLFGITADELLRGRRNPSLEGEGVANDRKQEREREMSEKSVRALAKRKLERLRWFSLIAAGIGSAGLVVALICDSVFFASKLGFFLSFLFYIPAAIMEIIALAAFFSSMEVIATSFIAASEERGREFTAPFRVSGYRWCTAVFTLLGGLVGMILPLAEAPPYRGGYIAPLGNTLCLAALGAVIVYLLCRWMVRRILVNSRLLPTPAPLTQSDIARRKLLKRMALILGAAFALNAIGLCIFNNLPVSTFAKAKVFGDYDSFVEYMELGQFREQGFSEEYIAQLQEEMEDYPDYSVLLDEQGEELCRYRQSPYTTVVQIKHSFDKSADGLPVYVYTDRAMGVAWDIRDTVNIAVLLLCGVETVICGVVYYRKQKRL